MKSLKSIVLILAKASVVLLILGFLILLFTPRLRDVLEVSNEVATLSKMKQLYLATQQMALDSTSTGNTNIGWPGDIGGSFSNWTAQLTNENYLSSNDIRKLLSERGNMIPLDNPLTTNNAALLVYAVRDDSPRNAVFLSTTNFINSTTGGTYYPSTNSPKNDTFVVWRKDGSGAVLKPRDAGKTNVVGSYVPLCH